MLTFAVTADNICKQFGQDQARQNVGPNLKPKCLTHWWYAWKNFLKKFILNKVSVLKVDFFAFGSAISSHFKSYGMSV